MAVHANDTYDLCFSKHISDVTPKILDEWYFVWRLLCRNPYNIYTMKRSPWHESSKQIIMYIKVHNCSVLPSLFTWTMSQHEAHIHNNILTYCFWYVQNNVQYFFVSCFMAVNITLKFDERFKNKMDVSTKNLFLKTWSNCEQIYTYLNKIKVNLILIN